MSFEVSSKQDTISAMNINRNLNYSSSKELLDSGSTIKPSRKRSKEKYFDLANNEITAKKKNPMFLTYDVSRKNSEQNTTENSEIFQD